jgi:hypothetical protein
LWKRSQMPLVCGLLVLVREMIDVLYRDIELVFMPLRIATVFAAAVGQNAQQFNFMLLQETAPPGH